jgi:hypothetical protein
METAQGTCRTSEPKDTKTPRMLLKMIKHPPSESLPSPMESFTAMLCKAPKTLLKTLSK